MAPELGAQQLGERVGSRLLGRRAYVIESRQRDRERARGRGGRSEAVPPEHDHHADHDAADREQRRPDEVADDLGLAPHVPKPPGVGPTGRGIGLGRASQDAGEQPGDAFPRRGLIVRLEAVGGDGLVDRGARTV